VYAGQERKMYAEYPVLQKNPNFFNGAFLMVLCDLPEFFTQTLHILLYLSFRTDLCPDNFPQQVDVVQNINN